MEIGKYSGETNKRTNEQKEEKKNRNKNFMTEHYTIEKFKFKIFLNPT